MVCVKELDIMSCPCQTTRTASEASSEFRVTGKINLPWVGTIRRRSRSMTARKVEEETSRSHSLAAFYIVFAFVQITRQGSEVNLVSRVTE